MNRIVKSAAMALVIATGGLGSVQAYAATEPHKCVYGTPKQEWYWWNDTRGYVWCDVSTCTYGCGSRLIAESKTTPPSNPPSERPTPTYPTGTTTPSGGTTSQYKTGDVNLDGHVNAKDATAVLKHVVELEILTGKSLEMADVNGDKHVNAKDATAILKIVVGLA